jgi:hypothetical protein
MPYDCVQQRESRAGSSMISKVKRADGVALSTCSESRLRSM